MAPFCASGAKERIASSPGTAQPFLCLSKKFLLKQNQLCSSTPPHLSKMSPVLMEALNINIYFILRIFKELAFNLFFDHLF